MYVPCHVPLMFLSYRFRYSTTIFACNLSVLSSMFGSFNWILNVSNSVSFSVSEISKLSPISSLILSSFQWKWFWKWEKNHEGPKRVFSTKIFSFRNRKTVLIEQEIMIEMNLNGDFSIDYELWNHLLSSSLIFSLWILALQWNLYRWFHWGEKPRSRSAWNQRNWVRIEISQGGGKIDGLR